MGKKTTETTTMNYDPQSKGVYGALQSPIQNTLMDYMKDPLKASYFNTQLQMASKQAGMYGQGQMNNITGNIAASGFGGQGLSPFMQSAIARQGRANSGMQSSTFNNLLLGSNQLRLGATAQAQGYTPLLNGQTSVTKTSNGVMGWLPGVLGAAAGAALAPFTGGMSLLAIPGALGSMGGGGGGGGSTMPMLQPRQSSTGSIFTPSGPGGGPWGGTTPPFGSTPGLIPGVPSGINLPPLFPGQGPH